MKQKMRGGESRAADGTGAFAWWNKPAGALRSVGSKSLLARLVLEVANLEDTHDVGEVPAAGLREVQGGDDAHYQVSSGLAEKRIAVVRLRWDKCVHEPLDGCWAAKVIRQVPTAGAHSSVGNTKSMVVSPVV